MTTKSEGIDLDQLERDGFTIVRGMLDQQEIGDFEDTIETLVRSHLHTLGITPRHPDPFIDVFTVGGTFTERFYMLMERLFVLQRISARVGEVLRVNGFLDWARIEVPLLWPDIRADVPNDREHALPVHQDFGSIQCERAWRLWIPLRPSNAETGSMRLYPGTHKLGAVEHCTADPLKPHVDASFYQETTPVVFDLPAGDAVIMNPLVLHASVPNRSLRTKFTLMVQLQDLTSMIDPGRPRGTYGALTGTAAIRSAARVRAAQARVQ